MLFNMLQTVVPLVSHTCRFKLKFMIVSQQGVPPTEGSEHTTAQPVHQQQVSAQLQAKLGNKCSYWALDIHRWGEGEESFPEAHIQVSHAQLPPHILFQKKNLHTFSFTAQYLKDGPPKQTKSNKKSNLYIYSTKDIDEVWSLLWRFFGFVFCLFFFPFDFQGLKSLMQFKTFTSQHFSTEITWTSWKGGREGKESSKEEMPP